MSEGTFRFWVVALLAVIAFSEVFAITKRNYPTYGEWKAAAGDRKEVADSMPIVKVVGVTAVSSSEN